jgi:hypothetical protein
LREGLELRENVHATTLILDALRRELDRHDVELPYDACAFSRDMLSAARGLHRVVMAT